MDSTLRIRILRLQILLFFVFFIKNSFAIDSMYDAGKKLDKFYSMLDQVELITPQGYNERIINNNQADSELKNQMEIIHEQLSQLDEISQPKIIQYTSLFVSAKATLYKCIDNFEIYTSAIDKYYEEFHECMNKSKLFTECLQQKEIPIIIQNCDDYIRIIRNIIIGPNYCLSPDQNLIEKIANYGERHSEGICHQPDIISNSLLKIFRILIIAEIKAHVMLSYGNICQYSRDEEWKMMNSLDKGQFQRFFATYLNMVAINMNKTDRLYMRSCDPGNDVWIRDKSFYELEGTFQATIFRYHWAACKHDSCNSVWFDKAYQCSPHDYDLRSGCSGRIAECANLGAIEACVLTDNPNKFKYVNSSRLGFLGSNSACSKKDNYKIVDGVGWDFNYAACVCNCYVDYNNISLSPARSNIKANRVIIGLRFIRKYYNLYIQPKTAKLAANGRILQYTQRWEQISNFYQESQLHRINKENRVFFFDDLRLPSGFVLTGVKFNKVTRGTVNGFAIEISGVPYDYQSGRLSVGSNEKISIRGSDVDPGMPLSFIPNRSDYTTLRHEPSSGAGHISLQRSTLSSDFGQSTLPFFDGVPVIASSSALGGIGIFHKGVEGYAGFISLRVYGLSNSKYFHNFQLTNVKNGKVIFD